MIAHAVRAGLTAQKKSLPSWLLYDERGLELFERITALPEYGLTRAETAILARDAPAIVSALSEGGAPLSIAELGAGTAKKTELLLAACPPTFEYVACDINAGIVDAALARLSSRFPQATLCSCVGTHENALRVVAHLRGRQVLLFLGSSIGNLCDDDAAALLRATAGALRKDGVLLLGTDLVKDVPDHIAAYDDADGVTAAFNKNVLERINRELDADFVVDRFRHVVRWNGRDIEMHLASVGAQRVRIGALDLDVHLSDGETIHTETSAKYDLKRVDSILKAAGFSRARTFTDRVCSFALHLARR